MDSLKQKILNEGEVYEGNILKVDGFLNHRIDIPFMREIAKEFHRLFKDDGVNKILTIEASGRLLPRNLAVRLFSQRKQKLKILPAMCIPLRLRASLTALHTILLCQNDFSMKTIRSSLLMIFLQSAMRSTVLLVNDSGASLAGCGVVIEKGFQHGGDKLRSNGIKVESLAIVESMDHETGKVYFRD